jgi:hypothetical protein
LERFQANFRKQVALRRDRNISTPSTETLSGTSANEILGKDTVCGNEAYTISGDGNNISAILECLSSMNNENWGKMRGKILKNYENTQI